MSTAYNLMNNIESDGAGVFLVVEVSTDDDRGATLADVVSNTNDAATIDGFFAAVTEAQAKWDAAKHASEGS